MEKNAKNMNKRGQRISRKYHFRLFSQRDISHDKLTHTVGFIFVYIYAQSASRMDAALCTSQMAHILKFVEESFNLRGTTSTK